MSRRTGSVVCPECGRLVGSSEPRCPFCGYARPAGGSLDGFLRQFFTLPLEWVVIVVCSVYYVASLALDPSNIGGGGLFGLLSPSPRSLLILGGSGALPVFGLGRWWSVLSASWLHGGLIHILFNMLWVRQLAPPVVRVFGTARTALIYVIAGALGFLLSSFAGAFMGFMPGFLQGATLTIGASASIFGLLGAIVHFGRHHGFSAAARQAWTWAVILFLMGFVFRGVDNYAHLGGFIGGYVASWMLNPTHPERPAHRLAAGIALLGSVASVVWAFFDSMKLTH